MELIPAHMNQDELMYLDILQGGPSFDDQWQIREYSKLEPLFKDEKFIQMMTDVLDQIGDTGDVKMQFERLKQAIDDQPIEFIDAPGDSSSEIQELSALGMSEGDNRIALLPPSVYQAFIEVVGDNKNPETGLNQFFFHILAALIAGSAASSMGAGIGLTALASGVGSFVGAKMMGQSNKDALRGGAITGLTAGLIPHVGGAFSKAFPGVTSGLSNLSTKLIGPGATGALGSMLTGTGPQYAAATDAAAKAAAGAAASGAGAAAAAAPTAATGLFGGSMLIPTLLTGAYQYETAKKQQKQYEKEQEAWNKGMSSTRKGVTIDPYTPEAYESRYRPNRTDVTFIIKMVSWH